MYYMYYMYYNYYNYYNYYCYYYYYYYVKFTSKAHVLIGLGGFGCTGLLHVHAKTTVF